MNLLINTFIQDLAEKYQGIKEIWWFGSRAINCNVTPESDWDFLVIADSNTFSFLQVDNDIHSEAVDLNIDLLLEVENGIVKSPWKNKSLKRDEMRWNQISEKLAVYWTNMTRDKTEKEMANLSEWEQYAIKEGADPSEDISDWRIAKRILP